MRLVSKIGLFSALALLPLLMAPSGGFPSRPRFQNVISAGAIPQIIARGQAVGNASQESVQFQDSAGTVIGSYGDLSATDSDTFVTANIAGANIQLVTTATGNVLVRGAPVPITAYATINGSGGGCTIGGAPTFGFASCSRSSIGVFIAVLNAGFAAAPVCVASGTAASAVITTSSAGPTSASYNLTVAGALADGPARMVCYGT